MPRFADPEDGVDKEAVVLGGHAGVAGLSREHVFDVFPILILDLVSAHPGALLLLILMKLFPILLKPPGICLYGLTARI